MLILSYFLGAGFILAGFFKGSLMLAKWLRANGWQTGSRKVLSVLLTTGCSVLPWIIFVVPDLREGHGLRTMGRLVIAVGVVVLFAGGFMNAFAEPPTGHLVYYDSSTSRAAQDRTAARRARGWQVISVGVVWVVFGLAVGLITAPGRGG